MKVVDAPLWAGVATIVLAGGLLLAGRKTQVYCPSRSASSRTPGWLLPIP